MRRLWVMLCVGLALGLRAVDLTSDPPVDLEESGGYFADEGFWTHNARNKVLFGRWVMDDWNNMYASPLSHWLQYPLFRLMGVGLVQARVLSVALSAVTCALLATLPGLPGALACLVAAVDPLMVHFGRLALLEPLVMCLMAAAWALLSGPGWRHALLGGVAAGLAVSTKTSVWYVIPAGVASLLLVPPPSGKRAVLSFLGGVALAGGLWLALVGRGLAWSLAYARFYASQQSPWLAQLGQNLGKPVLFQRFAYSLPTALLGFAAAVVMAGDVLRGETSRPVTMAWLWATLGCLFLDTLTYDPLRYYMPVLPALIVLASWCLVRAWEGRLAPRLSPFGSAFALVFLVPMCWEGVRRWKPHVVWWPWWRHAAIWGMAVGSVVVATWLATRICRSKAGQILAAVGLFSILANGCAAYAHWHRTKESAVLTSSRMLGQRFFRAVFTGQWAPELCLENGHQAVPVWPGFVNDRADPFHRFGITHGLIWGRHWNQYVSWFPEVFAHARILDTLWIKQSPVILCEFPRSP